MYLVCASKVKPIIGHLTQVAYWSFAIMISNECIFSPQPVLTSWLKLGTPCAG